MPEAAQVSGVGPDEQPKAQDQHQKLALPFLFVPVSNNQAALGRQGANQLVRAHVTRLRHATALKASQDEVGGKSPMLRHTASEPAQFSGMIRHNTQLANTSKKRRSIEEANHENEAAKSTNPQIIANHTSIPGIPAAKRAGAGREDPFWSYPVDYEPHLPAIFAHYVENIAVDIPELDLPGSRSLLRRRWFPLAMEAPSTMYAVLLMAAAHFCVLNPPHLTARINLLSLKSRALREINKAVRHPDLNQATNDAAIGAVMKMAAYEAIFGDPAVYAAHMKGLSLMLKKRGGLSTLGLDGLLERMVLWIDYNAAFIHNSSRALGSDTFPTAVHFDAPNLYHFAGIK